MDARLQELLDHHEIRKLIDTYASGSDRVDAERMASVFHSGSWVDHGADHCAGDEFVETTIAGTKTHMQMVQHLQGQAQIRVDGDTAGSETYFLVTARPAAAMGANQLIFMGGRYVDRFEKEDGAWKIKKRVCLRDWSYTQAVEQDFIADVPFTPGAWADKDESYPALGLKHTSPALAPA